MTAWPSVGVVIPTHNRPEQVRAALAGVRTQDYPGAVTTVIVHDRSEPDHALADGDEVRVTVNSRTPGLAGARNTGVLALGTDLIAFCDDDDVWLPGKLTAQVRELQARPGAEFASCGILVLYAGHESPRLAGGDQITYADLLRSRMAMVHSSTYLVERSALLGGIGLLDEGIPGSQNEDWDLALRAARRHPIIFADQPLVRVAWGDGSYYSRQWETMAEALRWMLDHHPDIGRSPAGAARVYGQIAFAYACLGRRGEAWQWIKRAAASNWHERRLPVALAVNSGLVSGETVLRRLHAHGHGI
jgi:glycosyltransferase involved in cell wall biosynthesis